MYNQKKAVTELKRFEEIFSSWSDKTDRIGDPSYKLPWPEIANRDGMRFSAFCQVEFAAPRDGETNRRAWTNRFYEVTVHDSIIDIVCKHTVKIAGDTMYFKIIDWHDGRSLVACDHNQIIGGVWLAVIETASIPRVVA